MISAESGRRFRLSQAKSGLRDRARNRHNSVRIVVYRLNYIKKFVGVMSQPADISRQFPVPAIKFPVTVNKFPCSDDGNSPHKPLIYISFASRIGKIFPVVSLRTGKLLWGGVDGRDAICPMRDKSPITG